MQVILPGSTIGIVGGEQLGKMMTLATKAIAYSVIILDEQESGPAIEVADSHIVASFKDETGYKVLENKVDVLTYEFENIDNLAIQKAMDYLYIPQGNESLRITQDRLMKKMLF